MKKFLIFSSGLLLLALSVVIAVFWYVSFQIGGTQGASTAVNTEEVIVQNAGDRKRPTEGF